MKFSNIHIRVLLADLMGQRYNCIILLRFFLNFVEFHFIAEDKLKEKRVGGYFACLFVCRYFLCHCVR